MLLRPGSCKMMFRNNIVAKMLNDVGINVLAKMLLLMEMLNYI